VTGLTVNLEGIGRLESDKVYDKDSSIIKKLFETAGGEPIDPSKY